MTYLEYMDSYDDIKFSYLTNDITYEEYKLKLNNLANEFNDIYLLEKFTCLSQAKSHSEKIDLVKKLGVTQAKPKIVELSNVSKSKFDELKSLVDKMKNSTSYSQYKPLFDKFSKILGIDPSVIITYKFKENKESPDNNNVYVRYETKAQKFNVPAGYKLYHVSPASDIKELMPNFKGKAPRNYFYSTPRVYVTLNKNMMKSYAQFKGNQKNTGVTKYVLDSIPDNIYLDDRIGNIFSGALYIEGNKPIKVTKVTDEKTVKEYTMIVEEKKELSEEEKVKRNNLKKKITAAAATAAVAGGAAYAINKANKKEDKPATPVEYSEVQNMLNDLTNNENKLKDDIDKAEKEWGYKNAIKMVGSFQNQLGQCKTAANGIQDEAKRKEALDLINKKSKEYQDRVKSLKNKDVKKQLNRFNNKYWIDYTKEHNKAFRDTEKEMRGFNTKRGEKHDMDKYYMYHFLPAPLAHKIHTIISPHHKNRAKTKEDYTQMLIDWECNRKTKPDKQLKPYQILDKFYPDLKSELIPIMKEYGIPINAEEDEKLQKSGKKYLPNSHNDVKKESVMDTKISIYKAYTNGSITLESLNDYINLLDELAVNEKI